MDDDMIWIIMFKNIIILGGAMMIFAMRADDLKMELKEANDIIYIYENTEGCSLPTYLKEEK